MKEAFRRTQNNDTRRPVTTFLILRPTELDHVFGSRMGNVYFT